MKAVCWCGTGSVCVERVPDPQILNPRDCIVRVTRTAICGSDLHIYDGCIPGMQRGDILGHEFMGEVVDVGREVRNLRVGHRVVVPFTIACGNCFFCKKQLWSLCDNSNPNFRAADLLYGHGGSALFGYSHLYGGFAGGQAELVRVPFADVGPFPIPDGVDDESVLFLSDIFPTGYMAVEATELEAGDTVAIWGCGPVGQFAIQSAWVLGAGRVIAIDSVAERLELARSWGKAETIDCSRQSPLEVLFETTHGRGPDRCVDAVGMEAHGTSIDAVYDRVKHAAYLTTDRLHALREAIQACRKGGTVSLAGVYGGLVDKLPLGAAFAKGLKFVMGQTHVHRYMQPLLDIVQSGRVDPRRLITHRAGLEDAPNLYRTFRNHDDGCIKVVLDPTRATA